MAKKKEKNPEYSVLLDTSFMIRFLNQKEPLHKQAYDYFKFFLDNEITMCFSTISVAEYCVRGDFHDIPYLNIRILPFNIFDAKEAGKYAAILFDARAKGHIESVDRKIIPNDTKLFAQAAIDKKIKYFVTADTNSKKNIEILRKKCNADFEHMDIHTPINFKTGTLEI